MKALNKRKLCLFFKGFGVTSLILGCISALIIGIAGGQSIMETERTGEELKIIEVNSQGVFVLGKIIYKNKT